MTLFEKVSYSVFLLLVGIIVVLYSQNNQNTGLEIYNKALITEEDAARYLSMDIKQFRDMVKREEGIKEEAMGMNVDPNATLDWWTIDNEKYFSPVQMNKWIEYNMARTKPIIPE